MVGLLLVFVLVSIFVQISPAEEKLDFNSLLLNDSLLIDRTIKSKDKDLSILSLKFNGRLMIYPDLIPQAPIIGKNETVVAVKVHFFF